MWSPDGAQIAWLSDASGEYQLMIGEQTGAAKPRVIALPSKAFFSTPVWSPDGKQLLLEDNHLNLWAIDIASGAASKLDTDTYDEPGRRFDAVWSPDSRWVAYSKSLKSHLRAIFLYSIGERKAYQVTDGLSDATAPGVRRRRQVSVLSGQHESRAANELPGDELGRSSVDPRDLSGGAERERAIAVSAGDRRTRRRCQRRRRGRPPSAAGAGGAKPAGEAKAQTPATLRIDVAGIDQRILALAVPAADYSAVVAGPAGTLFYAETPRAPGAPLTIHRYQLRERRAAPFLEGVRSYTLSADAKRLLYRADGNRWGIVPTDRPGKSRRGCPRGRLARSVGRSARGMGADLPRDLAYPAGVLLRPVDARRRLAGGVRQVPAAAAVTSPTAPIWDTSSPRWAASLASATRICWAAAICRAATRCRSACSAPTTRSRTGAIASRRSTAARTGIPSSRRRSADPASRSSEGDYLLEVNGRPLAPPTSVYQLFEGTAGKQTLLRVNSSPSLEGSRVVTVVPVASDEALRTRAWIEGNRRLVDKLSGGRLAYVWLPNTGGPGYTAFNRYYYAQQDKEGAVIDERYNQGGMVADYVVNELSRPLMGYFARRGGAPSTSPAVGIYGPKVMIINESAGSGGDALPYYFKQQKVGPLVGTRTWGALVGTLQIPADHRWWRHHGAVAGVLRHERPVGRGERGRGA